MISPESFMQKIFSTIFLIPLLIWADSVEISDGSVLQGKILGMVDGNLTIQTSFAGKIKVPYNKISSINSDSEISIRLDDNRTFDGLIDQADDNLLTIRGSGQSFLSPTSGIFGTRFLRSFNS